MVPGPGEECASEHLGPDLTDGGRSTLRASGGEQPADGVTAHTVQVAVQDAFGNPVTGTEVDVQLPAGLVAVDGAPASGEAALAAGAATTVSTGTTGVATLAVAATEPGAYTLAAAVAGEPVRNGAGVTVTFAPVGGPPVAVPEVPGGPGAGAGGVGTGVGGGAAADVVAAPGGAVPGSLARTGATVAALLAAALAAVAAGWGLRRVARR